MKRHLPFVWMTMAFVAGIVWHSHHHELLSQVVLVLPVLLGAAYVMRRKKVLCSVALLLIFILLGWLCTHSRWMFGADHIYFQKAKVQLTAVAVRGTIVSDVRRSRGGYSQRVSFVMALQEMNVNGQWERVSGKILANLFRDVPLNYGDDIVLVGKLHPPFEFSNNRKFSYRRFLNRQGIYFVLSVKKASPIEIVRQAQGQQLLMLLFRWRNVASSIFEQHLRSAEAALMQAMVLGERREIPDDLRQVFVQTGTAHILAISGLHVGIVVAVVFLVLRLIPGPMTWSYLLTMIFIVLYVLLTGARPSVLRAGMMAMVFLMSFLIERETDSINSLAFAAFLLLIIDPQNIVDVGFQLSFVSVLAILLFCPLLIKYCEPFLKKYPNIIVKYLTESFIVSLSAIVGITGLIAYYFQIVTPVALLANIVVVPLSALALILGIGMLICGVMAPLFTICIQCVLSLMVWVMTLCQQIPGAYYVFADVNVWSVVSYYCCVISVWLWLKDIVNPDAD